MSTGARSQILLRISITLITVQNLNLALGYDEYCGIPLPKEN